MDAGYYPQKDRRKKNLSYWHRYYRDTKFRVGRKGVVGTKQERERSEKTQPEVHALQRPIQERLEQRERASKKEDEYRLKITDQQAAMARLREDVQRL